MHLIYKIHKIVHIKKELKEIYANQVIETLALFIIGIFIPAFLLGIGMGLEYVMVFMLIQLLMQALTVHLASRINASIGIKHTILLRSPILIAYLAMVMNMGMFPQLYLPAALMGGFSLSFYWVSINTEYVKTSDKRSEGDEAGLLIGLPHIAAVIGPLGGAAILTVFGFHWLFSLSVGLITLSVVPLFLSSDFRSEKITIKKSELFIDKRRLMYYFLIGIIYTTDFVFWSLHVFMNYGFISLGIAGSLMGLGMLFFIIIVGNASNTIRGRRRVTRIGGFLGAALWIMRFLADSQLEFMFLSLLGGFIITSFWISMYADFAHFAKKSGPVRCVVFRQFWMSMGHASSIIIPLAVLSIIMLSSTELIRATFIIAALASLILVTFKE